MHGYRKYFAGDKQFFTFIDFSHLENPIKHEQNQKGHGKKKSNKIVMISNDLVLDFIIGIIQIGDTMHHIRRGYFHYSSITTLITNKFQQSRFIGISIVCKCICARLRHNYFFGVSYKT